MTRDPFAPGHRRSHLGEQLGVVLTILAVLFVVIVYVIATALPIGGDSDGVFTPRTTGAPVPTDVDG
jgi:hypothetical protein